MAYSKASNSKASNSKASNSKASNSKASNSKASNGTRVHIEVLRKGVFNNGTAWGSVKIGGLVILHNLTVRYNKDGKPFLAFPSYAGTNDKYYSYSYIEDDDLKKRIIELLESEE